ncbi:PAS domain S-box protein [Rhodohalobacter sp. SW132]|uniref:PAS domain-containing protein n=1 Tax=Rhodohalobacter sp. SW132 TaxID=2293433 RepID=UPI000E22E25D|nr:PAS domain-containing protein [Rhodohalobacter sp. SW132]REL24962.1 PAS domain S-box protein [Rhodohalobacter sp. SW132]
MKFSPLRIALIYLVIALIWITTTDTILEYFVDDVSLLTNLQIAKGWFYVLATAFGLYYLINEYQKQITADKKKLQRVDQSLTMALETAKTATWEYFIDTDSYITSSNHNRFFDYPASEEMTLRHVYKRLHPDDLDYFTRNAKRTIEDGDNFNVEYRILDSNDEERWLWTKGNSIQENGSVNRVVGITSDITESKNLRKKLDLEREKFESLFDEIPILITVFNENLEVTEVNREFEKVIGWSVDEKDDIDLVEVCYPNPEERKKAVEFMQKPGTGWKEFQITTRSGEVRTQVWSNVKLSDNTIVGIGHDITEREKLEKENLKDKEKLLEIFNNLPVFINIHDEEKNVINFNDFAGQRLGYTKEDLRRDDFLHRLMADEKDYKKAVEHMQQADHSWENFRICARDGEVLNTTWMNMELSDDLKIGVGIDLTEVKGLEEQLKLAVESGGVGLWDFNPADGTIQCNDEWAEMIGYTREELEPITFEKWESLTHPDDVNETKQLLEQHFSGEIPVYDTEIRMRHKDGRWVWMIDRGKVTERDSEGNVVRMTGTHVDISDIKELERQIKKSRERLKLTTNSANVGLWEWNPQTGDVVFDEIWARLVGYTIEELEPISIETWNQLVHPDDLELFTETVERYFEGESDLYECEVRMRHKDGHWVWILDRGRSVEWNEHGESVRMVGTHVDITARKKKEEELEESERFLRETQRVANLATYTLDIESGYVKSSDLLRQMFWVAEDKNVSLDLWENSLHPNFRYVAVNFAEAMEKGETFEAEYKIRNHKNKQEKWIYEKADVEFDRNGNPKRMIGVMLDVTRTKEQQIRIRRTLDQLRVAEKIAGIGYWEKNLETGRVFWGDNKYRLLDADKSMGPLSRKDLFEKIHPDDKEATLQAYENAEKNGSLDVSFRYKQSNGTYLTISEKADIVTDQNTGDRVLKGVSMDVSSFKEMESELEDERKRLKIITSLVSDVVWDWDLEKKEINWSEGIETVLGFNRKEIPDEEKFWISRIHPEDVDSVLESIDKALDRGKSFWSKEYRFFDHSEEIRYILDQGYIYRNKEGEAVRIIGAMIDQTESKHAEMVLGYQAKLLTDISDAVVATDDEMKITSWNRAAEELYGWSEEEVLGKPIEGVIVTEFENISRNETREVFKSEGEWSGEVIQYTKSGNAIQILSTVRMLSDSNDEFTGAVAVNKDITALKKIQKRLDYEQKRFEYVTSVVSDVIWDYNPKEGTVWWSEGLETHYKHAIPDLEDGHELWVNHIHPEDRDEITRKMKDDEDSGETEWRYEYRFIRGDGKVAHVNDSAFIVRDEEGEIERVIGAMNDITVQKEAEEELRRSEQQYRLLYRQSPLPMWIYDTETFRFLSVNDAAMETYGYSEKEFLKMTIFDLFLPEKQDLIRKEAAENLKQPRTSFDVWEQKVKSGETIFCELSGSNIYFRGEQQRLVVSVDVTEQKKAEELAIKSIVEGEERERHRIANELHDGLGQYLSAANMHLSTVYSDVENLHDAEEKAFKTGLQMLQYAISETRSISHNLLPKSIQDYGLKLAVESLINDLKQSMDIQFHLFQKYDDEELPDNIQINIYRIMQEALNNSIKHANCSIINAQLVFSDNELICTVEDDGVGFDPENPPGEGLGLQSIKTRVAAMSGNLDIDSKINIGTLITIIVPLQNG